MAQAPPSRSAGAPQGGDPTLLLIGTDHRRSPLDLRERVAFGEEETEEALVHLLARPEIEEAYLLSTCNRTEVYLRPGDEAAAYETALEMVFTGREPELARPGRLFVERDADAARHLIAVASGLESMVLGEPEILGQVKGSADLAQAVGACGPVLSRLLRAAAAAGGKARAETGITRGAVSLGYAVVELARAIFTDLPAQRVLLVGAGETARLVAQAVTEQGIERLVVANRSAERCERFLERFPAARAVRFEERAAAAAEADVVVAATAAEEPVLGRDDLAAAMAARPSQSLLVVDLGVPRNVDPEAGRLENLFLHSIDSLEGLIERNLKRRREAVPRVEELVDAELERFRAWYRGLAAEPLVASLQKQAERIRRRELEAALASFPPETHEDLDRLTRALVRKILHHPSTRLRGGTEERERIGRLDLVRELFRLDETEEEK